MKLSNLNKTVLLESLFNGKVILLEYGDNFNDWKFMEFVQYDSKVVSIRGNSSSISNLYYLREEDLSLYPEEALETVDALISLIDEIEKSQFDYDLNISILDLHKSHIVNKLSEAELSGI